MIYQIFINDEEVRTENTFTIKEEFLNTSNIILNKVYPKSWSTDKLLTNIYFPKDYSKCKILRDGKLYFSGYVKNSGDTTLNFYKPKYATLQVLDYRGLLSEGKTLDFVITNKTIEQAIELVIEAISDYGFVKGNILIDDDTVIGAYSTLEKSPFDVFQYFSEISNCLWTTRIIDEEHTAIDFYSIDNIPKVENLQYTEEYLKKNKIEDIKPSFSTNDYRNRQIILSDNVASNIDTTEIKISNGYSKQFTTEQKIDEIKQILVNNEEKTFATTTERDFGIVADFYYISGENQFESDEILKSGTKVSITYVAKVTGREIALNNEEINRITGQLHRSGIIERYENRNDSISIDELNRIANNYIKFNSKAEISLKVITKNKDIFKIGQQTHFDIDFDILNDDYLVKSKETKIIQSGTVIETIYTYTLTNNFNAENALNFFDNQRRKSAGNIKVGESINRNVDIENMAQIIFKNPIIEEAV